MTVSSGPNAPIRTVATLTAAKQTHGFERPTSSNSALDAVNSGLEKLESAPKVEKSGNFSPPQTADDDFFLPHWRLTT